MANDPRGRRHRLLLWIAPPTVGLLLLVLASSDLILNAWVVPRLVAPALRKQGVTLEPGRVHWRFTANLLKIRAMNPDPKQPPRVGHVAYDRAPADPFFGYLWIALRGGLGDVIGF